MAAGTNIVTGSKIAHAVIGGSGIKISHNNTNNYFDARSNSTYAIPNGGITKNVTVPVDVLRQRPVSNTLEINENGLEKIFHHPDVINNPVAIISIVGPFRMGKSFLLNLLMKILQSDMSSQWVRMTSRIDEGFPTGSGVDGVSCGVSIWPEPFLIKTSTGTVAVLLMDTQGVFDGKKSKAQDHYIFAFTSLLSSVQIYNEHSAIRTDKLENFEMFAAYSQHSMGHSEASNQPYQRLLFLVQNWCLDKINYPFGEEGGTKRLKEILQECGRTTKANIESAFRQVTGFHMCSPGKTVVEGDAKCLKDIDKQYLDHVYELGLNICGGSRLQPKTVNGAIIKGGDCYKIAKCFAASWKGENVFLSITEANTEATFVVTRKQVLDRFTEFMKEKIGDKYTPELPTIQSKCTKQAMSWLDSQPNFGSAETRQRHRSELEQEMTNMKTWKYENDRRLEVLKTNFAALLSTLTKEHHDAMKNMQRNRRKPADEIRSRSKGLIANFEVRLSEFKQTNEYSDANLLKKFYEDLENDYQKTQHRNRRNLRVF